MDYQDIAVQRSDGVVTLTLSRPQKLNALGRRMLDEMAVVLAEMEEDDGQRVLVITGRGRAFCSGADLTDPVSGADPTAPDLDRGARLEPFARYGRVFHLLRRSRKPLIAAVNGIASGAGLSLAAACDIRIASRNATFSAIFVKRGLIPDCGATFTLPRLMGSDRALEMMWTGDFIDAEQAHRRGLVSRVVAPENLMEEAAALARRIASGPSVAIELTKRIVYKGLENDSFEAQLAWEAFAQRVCQQSEDAQEGIRSFLEKREPSFSGR